MALRDVRLVERVDGDGVGEGGRGTTGGGGALEGPRSMAAAILSGLRRCAREAAATSPSGQDGHSHFAASQTAPAPAFQIRFAGAAGRGGPPV